MPYAAQPPPPSSTPSPHTPGAYNANHLENEDHLENENHLENADHHESEAHTEGAAPHESVIHGPPTITLPNLHNTSAHLQTPAASTSTTTSETAGLSSSASNKPTRPLPTTARTTFNALTAILPRAINLLYCILIMMFGPNKSTWREQATVSLEAQRPQHATT